VCCQRRAALLAARPVSAASGGPVSAPLMRRRGGLPPPQAGLPGIIRIVGGRTPDTPAAECSAALRGRWVTVLGLQAPASPCAPCARRPVAACSPPPTLVPSPCSPSAASGFRVLRAAPARPSAPRGSQEAANPRPARRNPSGAAGRAPCGQGHALRYAPGGSPARQPGPRPPRCWPNSCRLAEKPGWARSRRASVALPLGAAGRPRTLINCLNTGSQKARKCRGRCSESVEHFM